MDNIDLDLAVHNAPNASGIYTLRNTSLGKCYIGQAVNMKARMGTHLRQLRAGKHPNPILQAAFKKYAETAWVFEIVELCERSSLTAREAYWATERDALRMGYNSAPIQSGVDVTEAFIEIARKAALKAHANMSDEDRTQAALRAAATRRKRRALAQGD